MSMISFSQSFANNDAIPIIYCMLILLDEANWTIGEGYR